MENNQNEFDNNINESATLEDEKKQKLKKGWKRELLEWVFTIAIAIAVALVIRTYVFEPVKVQGRSMQDTLMNGEIMIVTKYDYLFNNPNRFDIVTCHYPNRKESFVKRVVGLPGDTVAIEDGILKVNGLSYPEEYIVHRPNYELKEYKVPENMYFVLGDNRSNSNDSHSIGPISRDLIKGHVRVVVYPFLDFRVIHNP